MVQHTTYVRKGKEAGCGLHVGRAGHVLLHLGELLDVIDRRVKPTIDRLEASDRVLSPKASCSAKRVHP